MGHRFLSIVLIVLSTRWADVAGTGVTTESLNITLPDETELRITVFPANGPRRVVWFPSVFGRAEAERALLTRINRAGIEVWLTDILTDRFLPRVNSSLERITASDTETILLSALARDDKRVFLVGMGRGAVPILRGAAALSTRGYTRTLQGVVLLWPSLYVTTPAPGQDGEYLPIISRVRTPLLIYQPELSIRHWYLDRLQSELASAQVPVLVESAAGVRDGFFTRQEPLDAEVRLSETFPAVFELLLERLEELAP